MTPAETMRRLRLGNLRRLFRDRYGAVLPDDDAGRSDLYELLLPISVGPHPDIKMPSAIEVWAPWMKQGETDALVEHIHRTPLCERKPTSKQLGERLRLTVTERQRLKLWTIRPYNMDKEELAAWRKANARARMRRLRQKRGSRSRTAYLAQSKSRQKPWEKAGVSRATWYRQNRETTCETSPCALQLINTANTPVSRSKRLSRKERAIGHRLKKPDREAKEARKARD